MKEANWAAQAMMVGAIADFDHYRKRLTASARPGRVIAASTSARLGDGWAVGGLSAGALGVFTDIDWEGIYVGR